MPQTAGSAKRGGVRARRGARGFTIIELIVVTVIGLVSLLIAIPAFNGMVASQNAANAQTQLQAALRSARDLAARSATGQDSAAVFVFEPGGRTQIVIARFVGTLVDLDVAGNAVPRDVFVPVPGAESTDLPTSWMVRGFAPANFISQDWYATQTAGAARFSNVNASSGTSDPAWVFPETSFYDATVALNSRDRNTFMVRFQGGTGAPALSDSGVSLVVLPRPSDLGRPLSGAPSWTRVDVQFDAGGTRVESTGVDLVAWSRRVLTTADLDGSGVVNANDQALRQRLIGAQSTDVVRARTVPVLALYNENDLAATLNVRPDPISRSLYLIDPADWTNVDGKRLRPRIVPITGASDDAAFHRVVTAWIEGQLINPGAAPTAQLGPVQPARLFVVSPVSGQLRALDLPPNVLEGARMPNLEGLN
jgi:prepilin-type N-terminal cleavage/methylation domain-containing protein